MTRVMKPRQSATSACDSATVAPAPARTRYPMTSPYTPSEWSMPWPTSRTLLCAVQASTAPATPSTVVTQPSSRRCVTTAAPVMTIASATSVQDSQSKNQVVVEDNPDDPSTSLRKPLNLTACGSY